MSSEDAYANIVQLYDLEHDEFTDDIDFLLELAGYGKGPILELGCGTGRVLEPLAREGHRVAGLDSSEAMLQAATRRMASFADVSLQRGDMAVIGHVEGGPFGLIFASLNSIMHLTSQDRQLDMVRSSYAALMPSGRLVIDTLNPTIGQLNHLLDTTHREGSWQTDDGTFIDKWGHRQAGADSQLIDTLIWYDHMHADGTYQRTRTRFDLRYIHQSELELMLGIAGFADVDWYGSYSLNPWDAEAERIIAVAHKD